MALQHFYSRVPARVSLYNKADGFDTFAQSAELEREFVEGELAYVYENKLGKNDMPAVLRGQMPCVYTQSCTRSGRLVQNKITYIPSDYTGERSAYLSHSLIFSEDEKKQILSSGMDDTLNPSLFSVSIDDFQIAAPGSVPDTAYPCATYLSGAPRENGYLLSEMNPETVESFLYAILNSICGKGKNVCFKLSEDSSCHSERSLQIFNEILSILPPQLRGTLSFASYVTDPSQHSNYKLRGVSLDFPENTPKCVCIDLQTNLVVGVRLDDVVANKDLIRFFYLLLQNKTLRTEFLDFTAKAADAIPSLQTLNFKVLANLVFLFQCSCGMFPEQEILPDDNSIYDYLCAYEKYRAVLSDEYRVRGYRCLLRYRENHQAIPKNIFAKVSRLYGTELPEAKRIVMAIALELIHTDVMREKLFAFIKNYYKDEDPCSKQIIIDDLVRVFYGGFLQVPLLTFFSECFAEETEESKTLIFEKLLLSIRTPAVQGKILNFIEQHYEHLSDRLKNSFYDTFFEMLPECDTLSKSLVRLLNRLFDFETDSTKQSISARIIEALEADYRRKEHQLLPVLSSENGFCRDIVIALAYGDWQSRKLHSEYTELLRGRSAAELTEILARVFALVPGADRARLLSEFTPLYQACGEPNLYSWLDIAEQISAVVPADFAENLHKSVFTPAVCRTATDVFDVSLRADGMALLEAYAASHPAVCESENYRIIADYRALLAAASRGDYTAANDLFAKLSAQTELSPGMAAHIAATVPKGTDLCIDILRSLLKNGSAGLAKCYSARATGGSEEQAMEQLITVCTAMCAGGAEFEQALTAPNSGLREAVSAFAETHGRGARHWLRSRMAEGAFAASVEQALLGNKKGGFFSRLFKK